MLHPHCNFWGCGLAMTIICGYVLVHWAWRPRASMAWFSAHCGPLRPGTLGCKVKHDQNEKVAHQDFSDIWKLLCFNDHALRQMKSEVLLHSRLVMTAGIFRVRLKFTCIALWDPGQYGNRRQNWLLSWQVFQSNSKITELICLFRLIFAYFAWCLNCMHLL